jgi:lysophospholipase L1-like esterase
MGDNDIRQSAMRGSLRVVNNTKRIIQMHEGTSNPLVVMGLIPSPQTHNQTHRLFDYTDYVLKEEIKLQHQYPTGMRFGFARTALYFEDRNGGLMHEEFYEFDGIHLNERGARLLARGVLLSANRVARDCIKNQEEIATFESQMDQARNEHNH